MKLMDKFRDYMRTCAFGPMARACVCIAFAAVCGATSSLLAAEVTSTDAARAAKVWVDRGYAMGVFAADRTVSGVDAIEDSATGARLHVVKFEGGGFVVLSTDNLIDPVLSFSATGDGVRTDDDNPFWELLRKDIAARESAAGVVRNVASAGGGRSARPLLAATASTTAASTAAQRKWAALLGGGTRLLSASNDGVSSLSDMRVAPLVQSRWSQSNGGGDLCYNYFTPNNYPCGCVATAGAQIMRFFQWPSATTMMPQFTNPHCKVDGSTTSLTTQGGSYNWANMPLAPNSTISPIERQAIGKLTSDIGICCGMSYSVGGGSVGSYMLAETFTNHFGYGSALAAQWQSPMDLSGSETLRRALFSNFDAGLPVVLSLKGVRYDHAVVSDGYGYSDGVSFIHLNFGWAGISDAWYSPPNLNTGDDDDYNYNAINGFVFNIFPNMPSSTVICSGRVLDADGNPVVGAMVSYCRSNSSSGGGIQSGNDIGYVMTGSTGIYALLLQPGQYVVTASLSDSSATTTVTLSPNLATITAYPNTYWPTPNPVVNNRCNQDIVLSNLAGVAVPVFDPPSCLFYPTTNISITCSTPGVTIRYTLDGTEPTETSAVYAGPISISDDSVITAKAWADGMNPSAAISATYTYDASQGAPKGDYFADPIIIFGASGTRVVEDNSAYTVEQAEPLHTVDDEGYYWNQYKTIWYEWTAPGSGQIEFCARFFNSQYYFLPMLAAYTGDSIVSLTRITYDDDGDEDGEAILSFQATQGETYRIVGISSYDGASGTFTLSWSGDLTVAPTVAPLEITTSVLPPATSGVPYSVTLEATGGVGECTWIGGDAYGYDAHSQSGSSFGGMTGTATGWKTDDGCWELPLPFDFPFYGSTYRTVYVSSNGTLTFDDDNFTNWYPSDGSLAATKMVAALWKDLDTTSGNIYVASNSTESVTVRWSGVYRGTSDAVSFAATLYPDGRVRLSYGAGNINGGWIGVSSGNEPFNTHAAECSSESITNSMNNAHDIVFTSWSPLPEWLTLSYEGVLSGTPPSAGAMSIHAYVMDQGVTEVGKTFNLTIEEPIDPLEMTTSVLPPATSGVPYSVTVEVVGGVEPYAWSAAISEYGESRSVESFSEVGTAMEEWREDDYCWELGLPFAFPFYGSTYSAVWVNSNGTLTFDGYFAAYTPDRDVLYQHPMIAALWRDLDMRSGYIYVASNSTESVTIRWSGIYYNSTSVSFSATLYADGTIRLCYGDGNANGGMIGISSGNFNTPSYILSSASESGSMNNASDIVFSPQMALLSRLSISPTGVLSGMPTASGVEAVTVFVTDYAGTRTGRTFNLTIEEPIDPLEITTSALPPATSGVPYSVRLEATGGSGSYVWFPADSYGYDESSSANSFSVSASETAMGWKANFVSNDVSWKLDLPFDFPFYEGIYSNVWVSAYGTLTFDEGNSTWYASDGSLSAMKMIAALWENLDTSSGDIYVKSSADAVTVRWSGEYKDDSSPVSFSATLYPDGRIRLSYGAGNANGGLIGVSSGDMGVNYFQASASFSGSMAGADDIVFTPWVPLTESLAISTEGELSGTPATAGTNRFHVYVMDIGGAEVMEVGKTLTLTINAPTPPVVSPGTNYVIACGADVAAAVAASMNEAKAVYIKAPETAGLSGGTAAAYANCFTARAYGNNVVIEINEAGTNALETASTNVAAQVAADLSTVAATEVATTVAITGAQPGFYYSVVYDDDLSTLGSTAEGEGPRALANSDGSVTLPIPAKKPNATSGFYRVKVSVKVED